MYSLKKKKCSASRTDELDWKNPKNFQKIQPFLKFYKLAGLSDEDEEIRNRSSMYVRTTRVEEIDSSIDIVVRDISLRLECLSCN